MRTEHVRIHRAIRNRFLRDALGIAALAVITIGLSVWLALFDELARLLQVNEQFPLRAWTTAAVVLALAFGALAIRGWWQFEQLSYRLNALYRTAQLASSTLEPSEVFRQVVEAMRDIMKYSHVVVMMVQGNRLVPMAWAGYPERPPDLRLDQGITGRVARTGQAAFVPDVTMDPDFVPAAYHPASEIACPIHVEGQVRGVLNVESIGGRRLGQDDLDLIGSLAVHLGVALHNATRYEHMREQAIRDDLTGLYDHAYFEERLGEEVIRARRYGRPLSLVMLDLDGFKRINDTYGHLEGDRALCVFAEFMQKAVRHTDLLARYGGEEFAIIMPETGGPEAGIAAERLRRGIEKETLLHIDGVRVSLTGSFGVAAFPEDADAAEDLIRQADEALYAAKKRGKNQVCARNWTPPTATPRSGTMVAAREG